MAVKYWIYLNQVLSQQVQFEWFHPRSAILCQLDRQTARHPSDRPHAEEFEPTTRWLLTFVVARAGLNL